jgi:hypothetical protein
MKNCFPRKTRLIVLFLILFFAPSHSNFLHAQPLNCTDLKNGVFVYFSYKDGSKSTYTRNGGTQKEFNPLTRESVLWDIQWIDDCTYSMQYNSGMEDKPKAELDLLRKHKIVAQIISTTEDYYIFKTNLDKTSGPAMLTDTLWIKQRRDQKSKITSNPKIDSILQNRKAAYDSVVSNSATLYVFRPGKFSESGINCILYINDTAVCEISNKATFVIRLYKEGKTILRAKRGKQESDVFIDVKKGNKYFLRCDIPWSLSSRPVLTMVPPEDGKPYFGNIK